MAYEYEYIYIMHFVIILVSPNAVLGFGWGRVASKSQHSIGGSNISKNTHIFRTT